MYAGLKKKEGFQHWQLVVDLLVMLLGLGTVFLGIFLFFNLKATVQWLPLMFLLACLVNLISAMKAFYYNRRVSGIGLTLSAMAIFGFAVVSYITCWT
jgi:hypothetical protein